MIINHGALSCRLNDKNSELYELWKSIQNLKADDGLVLDSRIKEILEYSLMNKSAITFDDISKALGVKEHIIAYRYKINPKLKELWIKVKKLENDTMKNFSDLKSKKYDYKDIIKVLNLSEDKFKELSMKYNKMQSILSFHRDSDITEKEILPWLLLSKREFELAINEIFIKLGYDSKTTRFVNDNGIDVVANRNGKTTIIECMHNIKVGTELEELLALQGNKYYYDADNVIYVASSGLFANGKIFADRMGENFKIYDLTDIIKLAKQYSIDLNTLEEKGNIKSVQSQDYSGNWMIPTELSVEENEMWRSMKPKKFERIVTDYFTSQGYAVERTRELDLDGYYIINKGDERSIIKCHNKNNQPKLDSIKALYGLKDFYNADSVILIGAPSLSSQSKNFIDTVNCKKNTKNSYKLYSLDEFINLLKDNQKKS